MPRTARPPSYRLHKARHLAVTTVNGRDKYLGDYGSLESYRQYLDTLAEWVKAKFGRLPEPPSTESVGPQIGLLILRYWEFAQGYYRKNGEPTDEQHGIRAALRHLRPLYGRTPIADFRPSDLVLVREAMIESDLSRKTINQYVDRIKRMFRWGVENELVPAQVQMAVAQVAGLKKGRSRARENRAVRQVSDELVSAALPQLSPVVKAMVEFQRLTGCRPGEVCLIRPMDIDRREGIWCYRPQSHKTDHLDQERRIYIGPRAQEILTPWLSRSDNSYCFNPRESVRAEKEQMPETATLLDRARRPRPSRRGLRYTADSYRRAVTRACERAKVAVWSPNRLRHSRATELREQYGLEAAQTVLGHTKADVTQIYAERDFRLAKEIMERLG